MISGVTKRIVVLKNLPSNIVEEAILILRRDPGSGFDINGKEELKGVQNKSGDFLLKEAEFIIDSYIRESKLQEVRSRKLDFKEKMLKHKLSLNLIINLLLTVGIIFLLCIVLKVI